MIDPAARASRGWTAGVAFAATATPVLVLAQILADPHAWRQMVALVAAGAWVAVPYAALALMAWRGSSRLAGWIALGLGLPALLALLAALVLGGKHAVGVVVFLAPAIGLTLLLFVACQLGLVVGGIALLRARATGGGGFAFVMALALAVGAGATIEDGARHLASPARQAAMALDRAGAAHDALLAAHRCLRLRATRHGAYPAALPDDCGAEGRRDGFALDYAASTDRQGFTLRAVPTEPGTAAVRTTDETGTVWAGHDPIPGMVRETILELDLCLEQYRLAHPARGYPRSLAAPDAEGFECFRRSGLGERIRSVVAIGESEGYRYRYEPADPEADGRIAAFRLDVRPVVYGRVFRTSWLCTPAGGLHTTDEDRPAEPSDRDEQHDAVTGTTRRSWCMGPEVPARR